LSTEERKSLVVPRNIASRMGRYYLRFFDLLYNSIGEIQLDEKINLENAGRPFVTEVPSFDILHKPESATPKFIIAEIAGLVAAALTTKSYIRIKYKNVNEQLSYRTLKDYKIVDVKEEKMNVSYLIGFCLSRQAERTFRIDRIQQLQQLNINF
jgi:hypothetical protein